MTKIDKVQLGETIYDLGVKAENIEGKVQVDLSNYYDKEETNELLEDKQGKLTAGENIAIDENNVISASGGTFKTIYSCKSFFYDYKIGNSNKKFDTVDLDGYNQACSEAGQFIPIAFQVTGSYRKTMILFPRLYNDKDLTFTGNYSDENGDIVRSTVNGDYIRDAVIGQLPSFNIWVGVRHYISTTNTDVFNPTSNYHPSTKKYVDDKVASKQDTLTAGANITIDENNVISATGGSSQEVYELDVNGDWDIILPTLNAVYKDYTETGIMPIIKVYDNNFGYKKCNSEVYYEEAEGYCGRFLIRTYYGDFDNEYDFQSENRYTIKLKFFDDGETHEDKFSRIESILVKRGMKTGYIYDPNHSPMQNRSMALSIETNEGYVPLYDTSPATKEYVDNKIVDSYSKDYIDRLPQKTVDEGFDYYVDTEEDYTYRLENISTREFVMNEDGYYESSAQGMANGFCFARLYINVDYDCNLTIDYINDAEQAWDFGMFSKVDHYFSLNGNEESEENTLKNCKYESSTEVKQLVYELTAGQHTIDVKFIKDGGGDRGKDSLQFKMPTKVIAKVPTTKYMATKEYVDNQVDNKQDALVAGTNITIEDNVISATGGGNVEKYVETTDFVIYYSAKRHIESVPVTIGSSYSFDYSTTYKMEFAQEVQNAVKIAIEKKKRILIIFVGDLGYFNSGLTGFSYLCSPSVPATGYTLELNGIVSSTNCVRKVVAVNYTAGGAFLTLKTIDIVSLGANNTSPYTPTLATHPATKGYVDDAIAQAGGGGTFNTIYYAKNTMLRYYSLGSAETTLIDEADLAEYNQACLKAEQFIPMAVRFSVYPNKYIFLFPAINQWGGLNISGGYIEESGIVTRVTINGDVIDNAEVGNLPQFNFWYIANGFDSSNYYNKNEVKNEIKNYVDSLNANEEAY